MKRHIRLLLLLLTAMLLCDFRAQALVGMSAFIVDTDSNDSADNYIPIPAVYEVYRTIKNLGDAGFMSHPEDIFVGSDGLLYVADTDNNRVLVLTRDGGIVNIITEACGAALKKPRGVFVHEDGSIWIADTGNLRIAVIEKDGTERKTFVKPASSLLEKNFTFDVNKLFVANTGYIYALKGANLITLDEANNFHGYLGADKVGFSLSRTLIRMFGSKSQVERTTKQEPASYSNFYIGPDNMIYGILSNKNTAQIRKLNTVGTNTYPEQTYGFMLPERVSNGKGKLINPAFADINVQENGVISVIDRSSGLIYQYDQEGDLICCFGGLGAAAGLFEIPVSIESDSDGYLYVVDYQANEITVLKPTHFVQLIHKAVSLHDQGRYDEALVYWNETLKIDSNYSLAHRGVAKIMGKRDDWSGALTSYKIGNDKEGYSDAFDEYRHAYFRKHFIWVVLAAAALALTAAKLIAVSKRKSDRWANDIQMGRDI